MAGHSTEEKPVKTLDFQQKDKESNWGLPKYETEMPTTQFSIDKTQRNNYTSVIFKAF
jgi:hypothetical protein